MVAVVELSRVELSRVVCCGCSFDCSGVILNLPTIRNAPISLGLSVLFPSPFGSSPSPISHLPLHILQLHPLISTPPNQSTQTQRESINTSVSFLHPDRKENQIPTTRFHVFSQGVPYCSHFHLHVFLFSYLLPINNMVVFLSVGYFICAVLSLLL